jgi:hypothetical protein
MLTVSIQLKKIALQILTMNTEENDLESISRKRTTSVRLEHLDTLEKIVREFGFKDRSHFFQLCTDALLQAHSRNQHLDWPPRFSAHDGVAR